MRAWGDMKGLKTVGASGRWKRWGNGFSPGAPRGTSPAHTRNSAVTLTLRTVTVSCIV